MKINSAHLEILRHDVIDSFGMELDTPKKFEILSEEIRDRIKRLLSVSTLKRIFGYIEGYEGIRGDSLDILSQFLGYPDWRTFEADRCVDEKDRSSHFIITDALLAENIAPGDTIEIRWNPKRRLLLKCVGDGEFDVIEAENSKITVGDTFRCERFIIGEPLYINNLIHQGGVPALFVAGKKGGLTQVELNSGQ
ncbi:MAG: hypothetical protein IKQ94_01750 [Bacteroidales bacterium]|nr:hypothetical protein [Bacteroidales bacterium]